MDLTKEQLSELICKHTEKENGLQDLLEIMLESLMVSERRAYIEEAGPLRELPSPDTGDPAGSGGRMRASCRHVVHERPAAGTGRRSVQRHLR